MSKLQDLRRTVLAGGSLAAGSIKVGIPQWHKPDVADLAMSASRGRLSSVQGETAT